MTFSGDIYGVVLNDREERARIEPQFSEKPYQAPPEAPVVYMKPRSAVAHGPVGIAPGAQVTASATLALLFARSACKVGADRAMAHVGAVALALDLSYPKKDYYRPAIAQQNADGFLALGEWVAPALPSGITVQSEGAPPHHWSLDRLVRDPATLIADLSSFMTLRAGDVLLIGLPGDAPTIGAGAALSVSAQGLPTLNVATKELAA